jgi:SNF2 family DNA or RNA helicase
MAGDVIKAGTIISLRNRLWRVDESDSIEITATPINGDSLDQKTFLIDIETINEERFESISHEHIGDLSSQNLLLRAYQFDLIHGSAPFLSLHRSSVVPYNYQMVPLVLAMEKPNARILIGDDVGLGKTVEAGLILSELIQRGKVKRAIILTPANLKQQWKEALEYFFHIKATIIDSFSKKEFEKELPVGANPWQYFQFVIASIDYAKYPDIKQQISEQNWDLLLVDEVHLSARPHNSTSTSKQQKRYELIRDLGLKIENVLFLTATPHNGYSDSFASILEILNPLIVGHNPNGDIVFNKTEARFNVVQRNRKKLEAWYAKQGKLSPFPKRNQKEVIVSPKSSGKLLQLLDAVERYGDFILTSASKSESNKTKNIANWVAIHLQKRAISSPYAVFKSIKNRIETLKSSTSIQDEVNLDTLSNHVYDLFGEDERVTDEMASLKLDFEALSADEIGELNKILAFETTFSPNDDEKLQTLKNDVIPELMGHDPKIIIFTKYKDTLDYLAQNLKSKEYDTFIIYGGLSPSGRNDVFAKFERSKAAILIATDVISEGLNLQRLSASVIHHELPWNPNRLEQRNGRVDRIGQKKDTVFIRTLVLDKSLDKEILDLLLEKQQTIELDRDYAAAFFGDEDTLISMVQIATKKNRKKKRSNSPDLPDLFTDFGIDQTKKAVIKSFNNPELEASRKNKIKEESFYSSLDIELPEIDKRIEETKRIVGSQDEVILFTKSALNKFGSTLNEKTGGFFEIIINDNRLILPKFGDRITKVTFDPEIGLTNPDAIILDAGHPIIRKLIQLVKSEFFSNNGTYGRSSYYFSESCESVIFVYNILVRFTAGLKEKRVIEELIQIQIDSYSSKEIAISDLKPCMTTRTLSQGELSEYLKEALNHESLNNMIDNNIKKRRQKLIEERRELYKKILIDSKNANQPEWLDEMIYIEEAGFDLLTATIVLPK